MLRIFAAGDGWYVDHKHAQDAADTLRLFGTYTIPLPYTSDAAASEVLDTVRRGYPEEGIYVDPLLPVHSNQDQD